MEGVLLCAVAMLLVLTLLRLRRGPVGMVVRLVSNTALGFGALWLTQWSAGFTGIALGINLWNALVLGVLGLPGFAFLLLAQWALK